MKSWIIIFYCINQVTDFNICIQFFFDFSMKCPKRCFSGFYFSAGKFPLSFKIAVATSRC